MKQLEKMNDIENMNLVSYSVRIDSRFGDASIRLVEFELRNVKLGDAIRIEQMIKNR